MIIFEIGQYFLYSWYCNWDNIPLTTFTILLFIEICCKLITLLIYNYGGNTQLKLIHKNIHEKVSEYKCFSPAKWLNNMEIVNVITTVPIFYFNQCYVYMFNLYILYYILY